MRRQLIAVFVAVAVLTSLAGCGRTSGKPKELLTHGTIRSVDAEKRTLVLTEKQPGANSNEVVKVQRTYNVPGACKITIAGRGNGPLEELKVGDKIKLKYTKEGDNFVAHRISPHVTELQPPPNATK